MTTVNQGLNEIMRRLQSIWTVFDINTNSQRELTVLVKPKVGQNERSLKTIIFRHLNGIKMINKIFLTHI